MVATSHTPGFTIVELLVVIVVIGILAVLGVVSYGTIRERAYNTQVISGVREYMKAIESFAVAKGRYPGTSRENSGQAIAVTCLGQGYKNAFCGKISGINTYEDALFNQQMSDYLRGAMPVISAANLPVGSESFTGAVYGIDITDSRVSSTGYARTIQYALKGVNVDCQLPGSWKYNIAGDSKTTACEIVLESVPAR